MKTKIALLLFLPAVLLFSQKNSITVLVVNPVSLVRTSETVPIDLNGLFQHYPDLEGKNLVVEESKKEVVIQFVDENGDGTDDLLIFQSSFKPKETKQFLIRAVHKPSPVPSSLVDGRFVLPREDFAWENDRVAFRAYGNPIAGDVRNGIDVWTKRVRYPIVEKWYAGEEQAPKIVYHEDHGEGADFFSVGRSLGCGSAGILLNGKLIQSGLFSFHRVITNGPLRISFELYYPDWQIDTVKYLEVKRVTLDAGEQLNKIETRFIPEVPAGSLTVAAGLVKRKNTTLQRSTDNRWMGLWGLTNADSVNGYLGTGVVFPNQQNVSAGEDSVQYLMSDTVMTNETFTYYSGFAWTRMGDIGTQQEWNKYLEDFATRVNNPLQVAIQMKK